MSYQSQKIRAGAHCNWRGDAESRQFFYPLTLTGTGALGSNIVNNPQVISPNFLETEPLDKNLGKPEGEADVRPDPRWWTIALWGYEVTRLFAGDPITAKPFGSPLGSAVPGSGAQLQRGSRSTHLQARIIYSNNAGYLRTVDVDIGSGIRVSVVSYFVRVQLLGTLLTKETVEGANPRAVFNNLPDDFPVVDALVCGSITDTWSSQGEKLSTFTQTVRVPAGNTDQRVCIPASARKVQVYQTSVGTVLPLSWRLSEAATAGAPPFPLGPSLGQLDFIPALRRTQRVDIPGLATHLAFDTADPDNERIFTTIWEQEL